MRSEVVHVTEEVLIVAESLEVNLVALELSAVKAVVELCNLMSVLARSWHLDRS